MPHHANPEIEPFDEAPGQPPLKPSGHRPATVCAYFHKYKAHRPPTCGCDMCELKWFVRHTYLALRP